MCMLYLMQEKWHCANFFLNCSCRLAANAKIYLENGIKFLEKSWKNPGILWLRKSGNPEEENDGCSLNLLAITVYMEVS